jgi:hypothetical protein
VPEPHPYDVRKIPGFQEIFLASNEIVSLKHLKWGLHRLYVDALLYFGNVRTAFRSLRDVTRDDLSCLFAGKRFDTEAIRRRGPPLPLKSIPKDSRYLISEMACKTYGDLGQPGNLQQVLEEAYAKYAEAGNPTASIRQLLKDPPPAYQARQPEFLFSADEVLDDQVNSADELRAKFAGIAKKFEEARDAASDNTCYYLSMVNDLYQPPEKMSDCRGFPRAVICDF